MSSTYCVRADIEKVFGVDNIAEWADLNNNDNAGEITAQITWAIGVAGDEIDDFIRATSYAIPLADASGSTPSSVVTLAAVIAGTWLYDNRGVEEIIDGNPLDKLFHRRQWARQTLVDIVEGTRRLAAL